MIIDRWDSRLDLRGFIKFPARFVPEQPLTPGRDEAKFVAVPLGELQRYPFIAELRWNCVDD
jgi:hypothetical protein